MKVVNPKCLCKNCKYQLLCKNHKHSIRLQMLANELGHDMSTVLIRTEKCDRFEVY